MLALTIDEDNGLGGYMCFSKKILQIGLFLCIALIFLTYTNCSDVVFLSTSEQKVLSSEAFVPENQMTGVSQLDDSATPANPFAKTDDPEQLNFVRRCTQEVYEKEKQEALSLAQNDPEKKTIPIYFSITTGQAKDIVAILAEQRSILRSNDKGTSYIAVSPMHVNYNTNYYNRSHHYVVDHQQAKQNYISGQKCYFDVVKITEENFDRIPLSDFYNNDPYSGKSNSPYYKQVTQTGMHATYWRWHNLIHGRNYSDSEITIGQEYLVSPRLFKPIQEQEQPQIVPLFVADISERFIASAGKPIISDQFIAPTTRGDQKEMAIKDVFNIESLFVDRHFFTNALEITKETVSAKNIRDLNFGFEFNNYDGSAQLLDNIIYGHSARALSFTYTPIVLDLGRPHILTSSQKWGTFFNLSNIKHKRNKEAIISHHTAWVGGYLVKKTNSDGDSFWQREAEDGFLVLPEDGQVTDSSQMFGDQIEINGQKFKDGFLALQSFANKNCESSQIRDRYLGPWDTEPYAQLRVWVDKNRNGRVNDGELKSLQEHNIAALNTCNLAHEEAMDQFKNVTQLRSAFLMMKNLSLIIESNDFSAIEDELKGESPDKGKNAEFRVAIDIYFQANPYFYLQNIELKDLDIQKGHSACPMLIKDCDKPLNNGGITTLEIANNTKVIY